MSKYNTPGLSWLMASSWEFLALTAATSFEVALAVLSLNLEAYDPPQADPLSGEKALDISESVELLDFSDDELISTVLQEVSSFLNKTVDTADGPDMNINQLISSFLLDSEGMLSFSVDLSFDIGGASIAVAGVRLYGLDSFTKLDMLDAIGSYTLYNDISLSGISFEADIVVTIPDERSLPTAATSRSSTSGVNEKITIGGEMKDIEMTLALLVAIDLDKLGAIEMGSMLYSSILPQCLLSALYSGLNVTELSLSIGTLEQPTLTGISSSSLAESIKNITTTIFNEYGSSIEEALPTILEIVVRLALDNILEKFRSESCPKPLSAGLFQSVFIDFRDLLLDPSAALEVGGSGEAPYGDILSWLKGFIDSEILSLGDESSILRLNSDLIAPLTAAQSGFSGTLYYPNDLFKSEFRISKLGFDKIAIRLFNLEVENLDTIGFPVSILNPSGAYELDNNLSVGCGGRPARISFRFFFSVDGDGSSIENDMELSLEVESVQAFVQIISLLDEDAIIKFPLEDIANLNCWIASVADPSPGESTFSVADMGLSVVKGSLNMDCLSCTSPDFQKLVELYGSPETSEIVTSLIEDLDTILLSLSRSSFIQDRIDQFIIDSKILCPHRTEYGASSLAVDDDEFVPESFTAEETESIIVLSSVTCSLIFLYAVVAAGKKGKSKTWRKGLSEEDSLELSRSNLDEIKREQLLLERTDSLAFSKSIPLVARILVPIVVIVNIAFFLSGHLSLGATVNVDVELAGETLEIKDFFEFSMAKSISQMWDADAKLLAVVVIIFSGIW